MTNAELFPETSTSASEPATVEWHGKLLDKWSSPRATVRLITTWHQHKGWVVGWFCMLDAAADEWHPANPDAHRRHGSYPWYRLDEMPCSASYAVACGNAARAVKIVMEQMKAYCQSDLVPDVTELQTQIEAQAMAWLQGRA